jgi:ATP-binding protein involved in chromosome partitioning
MSYTSDQILKALSNVIDPDLKKDLVSLGMIQNIEIDGNKVAFSLVLTTPACPLKNYLRDSCEKAIHDHISSDIQVEIDITSKVSIRRSQGDNELENLKGVKNIIAVVSGKGGVGKSTIAANLAAGLALEGASVGLLDGDIYGPSVPIMFGLEGKTPEVVETEGRQQIIPLKAFGVHLVSLGFFVAPEASLMWRGPMASNYLKQMITDTHWGELDYLIFDMPPGTGDMHLTLVQTVPVTGVVVVSTPQQVALADARKAVSMFKDAKIQVPILGMVENMSWFTPPELPNNKYYLFGKEGTKKLAEQMNLPLLGEIPIYEEICSSGDSGIPAVAGNNTIVSEAFLTFCRNTAQAVSIRNAMAPPTDTVKMNS